MGTRASGRALAAAMCPQGRRQPVVMGGPFSRSRAHAPHPNLRQSTYYSRNRTFRSRASRSPGLRLLQTTVQQPAPFLRPVVLRGNSPQPGRCRHWRACLSSRPLPPPAKKFVSPAAPIGVVPEDLSRAPVSSRAHGDVATPPVFLSADP